MAMKHFLYLIIFFCTNTLAQENLVKDIDFDGLQDTVYIDTKKGVIVCQLSTQNCKLLNSLPIYEIKEATNYLLQESEKGFKFSIGYNQYSISSQFRYEKTTKRIRLIGMQRRESDYSWYGANGSSSVNLLTNTYIGNWQYNDEKRNKRLIEIPTIKSKMYLGKIYIENFNEKVYNGYDERCTALFEKYTNLHKLSSRRD